MKKVPRISAYLCLIVSILLQAAAANSLAWQIIADDNDILVHQAPTPGSKIHTYRGTTTIELSTINSLAAILNDYSNYPRWLHYITETRELQRINANERYVRLRMFIPRPAKNREAILRTTSQHTPASNNEPEQLEYRFQLAEKPLLTTPKYHQFKHFEGFIRVELHEDNQAVLSYQIHADPGGRMGPRLSNHMLKSAPYFTLDKLRMLLQSPLYKSHIE